MKAATVGSVAGTVLAAGAAVAEGLAAVAAGLAAGAAGLAGAWALAAKVLAANKRIRVVCFMALSYSWRFLTKCIRRCGNSASLVAELS
jgi:hypothetical protein